MGKVGLGKREKTKPVLQEVVEKRRENRASTISAFLGDLL
jgi:hypothetical protein